MSGTYKDETGLVVKVEVNIVTLLSDLTMREVTVFSRDLIEATEVAAAGNSQSGGQFKFHDFVQIEYHFLFIKYVQLNLLQP
jgi:transcription elongation factor SPT5